MSAEEGRRVDIPSHGLARLGRYAEGLSAGLILPGAVPETMAETATSLVVDARGAMGAPASKRVMRATKAKARASGAAFVLDMLTTVVSRGKELGGHKGYGLAVMVDVLCSVLCGAPFGAALRELRESPPAEGQERVLYAGLPESESEEECGRLGVPVAAAKPRFDIVSRGG